MVLFLNLVLPALVSDGKLQNAHGTRAVETRLLTLSFYNKDLWDIKVNGYIRFCLHCLHKHTILDYKIVLQF